MTKQELIKLIQKTLKKVYNREQAIKDIALKAGCTTSWIYQVIKDNNLK